MTSPKLLSVLGILVWTGVALTAAPHVRPHRHFITITPAEDSPAASCSDLHVRFDHRDTITQSEDRTITKSEASTLRVVAEPNGGIQVQGWDGDTYSVTLCKFAEAGSESLLSQTHLTFHNGELGVSGPSSRDRWSAHLLIRAPKASSLDLSVHNGPLSLYHVDGALKVRAENGPVSATDCSGDLDLSSHNGPVTLEGHSGKQKIRTENGPVTVTLRGDSLRLQIRRHSGIRWPRPVPVPRQRLLRRTQDLGRRSQAHRVRLRPHARPRLHRQRAGLRRLTVFCWLVFSAHAVPYTDGSPRVRPNLPTAMTLPNFFIVGAPKAGTDELYYALDQHPQIYMSPLKEPCYFSSEIRPQYFHPSLRRQAGLNAAATRKYLDDGMLEKRFGGIISELSDYQRLFSSAKDAKAIGEGSVCYLWSPSASPAIASAVPHARIIIILMDPAERAFHQYLKSLSDGTVSHSFRTHLNAARHYSSELSLYHPFLDFGNYFEQVSRFMHHFPAQQLHISLYEDTRANYRTWFSGLLSFLEVDNRFIPEEVEVPSKPHVPRFPGVGHALGFNKVREVAGPLLPPRVRKFAKRLMSRKNLPELDPQDRAILIDYYRQDIRKLQDLIGRDLSAWLR
jgi:hypothetical protein